MKEINYDKVAQHIKKYTKTVEKISWYYETIRVDNRKEDTTILVTVTILSSTWCAHNTHTYNNISHIRQTTLVEKETNILKKNTIE